MVADLSLAPTLGQLGTPLVDVLATPVDATSGKPAPPSVTRPRYGEEVFVGGGGIVHITGIGGISSGTVRINGGSGGDVLAPVDGNGDFAADVPVALGTHTLKLTQQTTAATPCLAPGVPLQQRSRMAGHGDAGDRVAQGAGDLHADGSDPQPEPGGEHRLPSSARGRRGRSTSTIRVRCRRRSPTSRPTPMDCSSGSMTLGFGTPSDPNKGWHKLRVRPGRRGRAIRCSSASASIRRRWCSRATARRSTASDADPQGPQIAIGHAALSAGRVRLACGCWKRPGARRSRQVGAETSFTPVPQPGSRSAFDTQSSTRARAGTSSTSSRRPISPGQRDAPRRSRSTSARTRSLATRRRAASSSSVKPPRFQIPLDSPGVVGGRGVVRWSAHQRAAAGPGSAHLRAINSPRAGRTPTRRARSAR